MRAPTESEEGRKERASGGEPEHCKRGLDLARLWLLQFSPLFESRLKRLVLCSNPSRIRKLVSKIELGIVAILLYIYLGSLLLVLLKKLLL